ncbi:MAG: exo-alpha-sialidase, partial [bacterium]
LSATPYASMTWATGIDSSGRPIVNPAAKPTRTGVLVSPADYGGHNWNPTSFSPTTKLLYFGVTDGGVLLHVVDSNFTLNANDRTMGYDARYDGPLRAKWLAEPAAKGRLVAWDPVAKREAWRVDFPGLRSGGTLSTAGNIIFQGRGDGVFAAYRATDGKLLWHYDAQVGIAAAPMTYAVGGVQYVAILVAPPQLYTDPKIHTGPGRLLVFALDGKATLAPIVRAESPIAAPTFTVKATPAEIVEGRGLYSMYCRRCHNPDFNLVKSGAIPDLRRANEATHATFEQIVRGGARRTLGMPSFAKDISSDQVRLIQAYVLDQARQAAAPSTATPTAASATAPPPVFQRIKLEQSGDAGVHTYRIPALAVANDGTLIAAFDARNDSKGDLPGNIDVMVRRSRDLGRSWSAARRVVDFDAGRGGGDASLLVDRTTGRVFLFYVYAPAGMGIFKSNTDRDSASTGTVHPQVIWSDDHGASWKGPRDLTAQLKPSGATGMFATSGHGIQLSARSAAPGRLLQPYAWLDGERRMHAANAYSDDHGATWRLGASIGTGLDENKVVELSDGRVMQNIRSYAKEVSHRLVAISHDGGVHFDSAMVDRQLPDPRNNADIVRVAPDAAPATREAQMLLFSNTADEAHRRNLTVRLSCDSGRSWPVSKVVEPGLAMYSVMARLRDGTFGLLYENGEDEGLTFARFDLAWLGGGC